MKLRAPPGCGSISYLGELVAIETDGSIDMDDEAAAVLASHGFCSEPISMSERNTDEDCSGGIERLNRKGLFAFLRSKGVAVSLPITNEALRAAARRAIECRPK